MVLSQSYSNSHTNLSRRHRSRSQNKLCNGCMHTFRRRRESYSRNHKNYVIETTRDHSTEVVQNAQPETHKLHNRSIHKTRPSKSRPHNKIKNWVHTQQNHIVKTTQQSNHTTETSQRNYTTDTTQQLNFTTGVTRKYTTDTAKLHNRRLNIRRETET